MFVNDNGILVPDRRIIIPVTIIIEEVDELDLDDLRCIYHQMDHNDEKFIRFLVNIKYARSESDAVDILLDMKGY